MRFEKIEKGIFRLKVPFEDLFTSVFAVVNGEEIALIDTATTDDDVDTYIVPALNELTVREGGALSCILLTHSHSDHAGGVPRLASLFPKTPICSFREMDVPQFRCLHDGELVLDRLRVIHLPGHTPYSVGYFDEETRLLLSGDCLQLRGVGKYTNGVRDREAYLSSLDRLAGMEIDCIVAAHDYVPLGSTARGAEEIQRYLAECRNAVL